LLLMKWKHRPGNFRNAPPAWRDQKIRNGTSFYGFKGGAASKGGNIFQKVIGSRFGS